MVLTPEEQASIEERFEALEEKNTQLERLLRSGRGDNRIPLLATGFDIEDAIFPPAARVTRSAVQTISTNTVTALSFDVERFDTDNIHDNSTNPSRLTAKTAGKYLISGNAEFFSNGTGRRLIRILLNGSDIIAAQEWDTNQNEKTIMSVSTIWDMGLVDYVELQVFQNRGGDLNILQTTSFSPEFMMVYLGT